MKEQKKNFKKLYKKQKLISFIYIVNTILFVVLAIRGINIDILINPVFANTELIQEKENIITSDVITDEEESSAYKITAEERQLLAKLLWCEARGESYECQKAVISVVMNRVCSNEFPNNITDVIYQENQFEPVALGLIDKATPYKTQYDAIDEIINNGSSVPEWVCYFRAGHHFNWQEYEPFCKIDNTYFGGFER